MINQALTSLSIALNIILLFLLKENAMAQKAANEASALQIAALNSKLDAAVMLIQKTNTSNVFHMAENSNYF